MPLTQYKISRYQSEYGQQKIISSCGICDDEEEYRLVAAKFIRTIFKEFAKSSVRYYQPGLNLYEMPFIYSERRFDSVVLPILNKMCNGIVLTELPVERKDKRKEVIGSGNGRADYWCVYEGYSIVVEMKKSSHRGGIVSQNGKDLWHQMADQLQNVRAGIKEWQETTKGVIFIGLHFITMLSFSNREESDYKEYVRGCEDTMVDFQKHFKSPSPVYSGAWIVPKEIAMYDSDYGIYPYVMLYAHVAPLLHHKGSHQ